MAVLTIYHLSALMEIAKPPKDNVHHLILVLQDKSFALMVLAIHLLITVPINWDASQEHHSNVLTDPVSILIQPHVTLLTVLQASQLNVLMVFVFPQFLHAPRSLTLIRTPSA